MSRFPPDFTLLRKLTRPSCSLAGMAVPKFGYRPSIGPFKLFKLYLSGSGKINVAEADGGGLHDETGQRLAKFQPVNVQILSSLYADHRIRKKADLLQFGVPKTANRNFAGRFQTGIREKNILPCCHNQITQGTGGVGTGIRIDRITTHDQHAFSAGPLNTMSPDTSKASLAPMMMEEESPKGIGQIIGAGIHRDQVSAEHGKIIASGNHVSLKGIIKTGDLFIKGIGKGFATGNNQSFGKRGW